ncbi:MAG: DNA repair protein RecO C-terminal domain-containing protein [Treponema sp.]|jgi:DNA repair protein RecO (recombination protein O)|nr:DNA repair protein RecO C-terminal domain-containing protein [Treponema sp.]
MSRNAVYTALTLRTRPLGEANREAIFLTAEEGLVRATVFGGPKSKLRSYASTGHSGTLYIYHDPVKDYRKLTDFDVKAWRPGLRENYDRTMAAAALAETILETQGGGGSWTEALSLAETSLDALEAADEALCRRILLRFLWNWADILGLRPSLDRCGHCSRELPPESPFWYLPAEGYLCCPVCAGFAPGENPPAPGMVPVGGGARRWLSAVQNRAPALLSRLGMDRRSGTEVRSLVTAILAGALGRRLGTWDW